MPPKCFYTNRMLTAWQQNSVCFLRIGSMYASAVSKIKRNIYWPVVATTVSNTKILNRSRTTAKYSRIQTNSKQTNTASLCEWEIHNRSQPSCQHQRRERVTKRKAISNVHFTCNFNILSFCFSNCNRYKLLLLYICT